MQETDRKSAANLIIRNILWIAAALTGSFGLFTIWVFPVWLAMIVCAYLLERKNPPRNYRIIWLSALICASLAVFYILTVGLDSYIHDPLSPDGIQIILFCLPAIPTAALQMTASWLLSARKSRNITCIRPSSGI